MITLLAKDFKLMFGNEKGLLKKLLTMILLKMHHYIFQDLYEWAGEPRIISIYKEEDVLGGMSVEYSDPFDITKDIHFILSDMRQKLWKDMDRKQASVEFCNSLARLWKVHPFREGNTRTTITFCCQYADEIGLRINRKLFEKNSSCCL